MPSIYTELTAVAVLVIMTCYGSLASGAPAEVVLDFSTAVALMGLAITLANAAAREVATMAVRWGVKTLMHMLLL